MKSNKLSADALHNQALEYADGAVEYVELSVYCLKEAIKCEKAAIAKVKNKYNKKIAEESLISLKNDLKKLIQYIKE